MRLKYYLILIPLCFVLFSCSGDNWKYPFNGNDLNGWKQLGGDAKFEAVNGEIIGTTVLNTPNSFLVSEKTYSDFILEVELLLTDEMNSGIQFRSESNPEYKNGVVYGYQCEVDPTERAWSGGIYDESRRGWLYPVDLNPKAKSAFKMGQWNKFRIECIGNSLRTWVNGEPVAHLKDDKISTGFIALQVHNIGNNKEMLGRQVKWRNIRIKTQDLVPSPADDIYIEDLVSNKISLGSIANIKERIQPVPKESGFKMDGYWVWGGSVIKVDSTYHMFVSRWPKIQDFPYDYFEYSEIVRATSKSLVGPYEFQEVVIGERDSTYWDSNMAHNPTIHKIGDKYVLFYIGSDFSEMRPGSDKYFLRRIGYAVSSAIEGPWERADKAIIENESNNPAILLGDGGIKLIYRDAELKVIMAKANTYTGPYTITNNDVWPNQPIEDFYLFKTENNYHLICEDNAGSITGHGRWGAHLVSENGVDGWEKYKEHVVYDHDIKYSDGSILHCTRRERPQLFIEDGVIRGFLTGVYDGESSWCQPVELSPSL